MKRPWAKGSWYCMCAVVGMILEAGGGVYFIYLFQVQIHMCSCYIVAISLLCYGASTIGRLCNSDHELITVHELFSRSWNDHHILWATFVIIILVTNFSKRFRDHYIGNQIPPQPFVIIILVTSFSKIFRDHYIGNEISQFHDLQSLAQRLC